MSQNVPLTAAGSQLQQLIAGLVPGGELVLTDGGRPVAVVTAAPRTSWPSEPGTAKNEIAWMADDFNDELPDFAEY